MEKLVPKKRSVLRVGKLAPSWKVGLAGKFPTKGLMSGMTGRRSEWAKRIAKPAVVFEPEYYQPYKLGGRTALTDAQNGVTHGSSCGDRHSCFSFFV